MAFITAKTWRVFQIFAKLPNENLIVIQIKSAIGGGEQSIKVFKLCLKNLKIDTKIEDFNRLKNSNSESPQTFVKGTQGPRTVINCFPDPIHDMEKW